MVSTICPWISDLPPQKTEDIKVWKSVPETLWIKLNKIKCSFTTNEWQASEEEWDEMPDILWPLSSTRKTVMKMQIMQPFNSHFFKAPIEEWTLKITCVPFKWWVCSVN
jgi:hypothetical protein